MPHSFESRYLKDGRTVTEAQREIEVIREADVVVVGGGPGGTAAAITAARGGAKTILIERYGHLGGMATGGLVNIIPNLADIYGEQCIGGFCQELIDRLAARKAASFPAREHWGSAKPEIVEKYVDASMVHFYVRRNKANEQVVLYSAVIDPEVAKDELNTMCDEAGVELLLHSWVAAPIVEGDAVKGVIVETKSGRQAILAKIVIDSTGDGDIVRDAPTESVTDLAAGTRIAQFGYVYWMCGVDLDKYDAFVRNEPEKLQEVRKKIIAEGGIPFFFKGLLENQHGVVWSHRLIGSLNQTDPEEMTFIDKMGRHDSVRTWELLRDNMPGFENSFIMLSNPQLGTCGGRRLVGKYYLTEDDIDREEPFEDTIAIFADNDRGDPSLEHPKAYVPYRALVPKDLKGLLVACRAFSADIEFSEYFNLIPHSMCFGHAAGAAAAIAIAKGIEPADVPYPELKEALLKGGAILP
ncbi:MAG: FAD-dependent oxidoreductase [Oscillospiraceae bacterium]|nr:FAD-dependent oxidoreductase [Oscillospiraceae bacterium]